jgi:hypothetical protein
MPVCEHCGRTLVCPGTGTKAEHSFEYHSTEQPVLPCSPKAGLWVRVTAGKAKTPVKGVKVETLGRSGITDGSGFLTFDDVPPTEQGHRVEISLTEGLDETYHLPEEPFVTSKVKKGQLKFVPFALALRASPVIELPREAVAVGGARQKVVLKADREFEGSGTFTCTGGDGKVRFFRGGQPLAGGKFEKITETGVELEVEATQPCDALGGIELKWELDGGRTPTGPAVTKKLTAVQAVLSLFRKSGTALTAEEKKGDGLILHLQNARGERRRARATVTCKPADFRGAVEIATVNKSIAIHSRADGAAPVDLSNALEIGPDKAVELYVEGTATSKTAGDTGLSVKLKDLSGPDPLDAAKITVLETRLDVHAERPPDERPRKPEPPLIGADLKLDPGRTLCRQGSRFSVLRAMVRLTKLPHDAPCKLVLRSESKSDELKLFPESGVRNRGGTDYPHSHETPTDGEKTLGASADIAADAIKDAAKGLVYWVEGAKASKGKVRLFVDVDGVDEACDAVAFQVTEPKLTIKVTRSDKKTLVGDVDFKVKTRGSGTLVHSGTILKGSGELAFDIEAGDHIIELVPKDAGEAKMRLNRITPASQEAAILVRGPMAVAYELAPPYDEIQFIGYFIRTGPYIGTDDAATITTGKLEDRPAMAAKQDMEARAAIMADAIEKAAGTPGVKKPSSVLKIFMAPEFYFRGKQGAYPLDVVSEILNVKALHDEMAKKDYEDWLFVLGSAIGTIEVEGQKKRTDFKATITTVETKCAIFVTCPDPSPPAGVKAGWDFWYTNPDGAFESVAISAVSTFGSPPPTEKYLRFELPSTPRFLPSQPFGVTDDLTVLPVTFKLKMIDVAITSVATPAKGGTLRQGGADLPIIAVWPGGPGAHVLLVAAEENQTVTAGAATLVGMTPDTATVDRILGCRLVVEHPPSSAAAGAAKDWMFCVRSLSGKWRAATGKTFRAYDVKPGGTNEKVLMLGGVPVFPSSTAIGLSKPLDDKLKLGGSDKSVVMEADVPAGTIAQGQYLEQDGEARAAVDFTSAQGGTKHKVVAWVPASKASPAAGKETTFVDPGEAEIVNVALVCKGGSKVPVRPDGGAGRELLVYKEAISSVDFAGMDYGGGTSFAYSDRHAGEIRGDQSRRLLPTEGSGDNLGASPNVVGQTKWKEPGGGKEHAVPRITELSGSGLGGGSIFTMDDITFGLEVCLDHLKEKLKTYYDKHKVKGDPMVQVQLIPSCGMQINNRYCVADGLIFNVDATHFAAERDAGGSPKPMTPTTKQLITPAPADVDKHFDVKGAGGTGTILVYDAVKTPTKATV